MNDLVSADGLSYFVGELVEELYVAVGRDVGPEAAEETAGGGGSSMSGTGARRKEAERSVSKKDSRTSSARTTMRNVARLRYGWFVSTGGVGASSSAPSGRGKRASPYSKALDMKRLTAPRYASPTSYRKMN